MFRSVKDGINFAVNQGNTGKSMLPASITIDSDDDELGRPQNASTSIITIDSDNDDKFIIDSDDHLSIIDDEIHDAITSEGPQNSIQLKFSCCICGKTFFDTVHLNAHIEADHLDEVAMLTFQDTISLEKSKGLQFVKESHLNEHANFLSKNGRINCKICAATFRERHMFNLHMKGSHSFDCTCKWCEKLFHADVPWKEYCEACKDEKPACAICHKTFKKKAKLTNHKKYCSHAGTPMYLNQCGQCEKHYITKRELLKGYSANTCESCQSSNDKEDELGKCASEETTPTHPIMRGILCNTVDISHNVDTVHKERNIGTSHEERNIDTSHEERNIDTSHEERNIDTSHEERNIGTSHEERNIDTFHTERSIDTSHRIDPPIMTRHMAKSIFHCDTCKKLFTSSGSLSNHTLRHHQHPNYQCKLCARKFEHTLFLKYHMTAKHHAVKLNCKRKLKHPYHVGMRRFQCIKCGKRFGKKCLLKRHLLSDVCNSSRRS